MEPRIEICFQWFIGRSSIDLCKLVYRWDLDSIMELSNRVDRTQTDSNHVCDVSGRAHIENDKIDLDSKI